MSDTSSGSGETSPRATWHPYTLDVLASDPEDPDGEYTFVPRNVSADERLTQWLSADRDAVVELSAWR